MLGPAVGDDIADVECQPTNGLPTSSTTRALPSGS